MVSMIEELKEMALFSGLNEEELNHLALISMKKTYQSRAYVFMEGVEREAVFFIRKGIVKTFKTDEEGNEHVISLLQKGEMFPHVGFFDETPYPATAEIIQKAELIVIRIDNFDRLLIKQPQIAVKVMKIMGQKILMLTQRLQEFTSQDVQHRVIRALVRLADETGKADDKGIHIDMPLTNSDFANLVGTTRESINRVLSQLKREKLLKINHHKMVIYDLAALQKFKI